jgi:protein SCO1/2
MRNKQIMGVLRGRAVPALAASLLLVGGLAPAWAQMSWHRDYFPNVTLRTQDGKAVRFYDDLLKGKVVAISFIYTSCPNVCPLDTAKLRQVQQLLGDRIGKDIFFYSITLDPKTDTPPVLKRYMTKFDVRPGWTFLTGSAEDIALLQSKLGTAAVTPKRLSGHDTRFIFGNEATGQWVKRAAEEQPQVLANLLNGYIRNKGLADAATSQGYASAGRIAAVSDGERLFATRCSTCHTIGGGDGLGPDLMGITDRRSRAWVADWIRQPDRMAKAHDAATTTLVKRFRGLSMPKLGLANADVTVLVDFLSKAKANEAGLRR